MPEWEQATGKRPASPMLELTREAEIVEELGELPAGGDTHARLLYQIIARLKPGVTLSEAQIAGQLVYQQIPANQISSPFAPLPHISPSATLWPAISLLVARAGVDPLTAMRRE